MTKKLLMLAAIGVAMISSSNLFAETKYVRSIQELDRDGDGLYQEGEIDPCAEYRCGPATCTYPVTKFKKRTYCTKRCVQEPYTVRKKCTRYRPEYYTKTYCKKVPECYYTCETRYRTRVVTDDHCCYEPYTCYRTECVDLNPCGPCDQGGCPSNACCPSDGSGQVYNEPYYSGKGQIRQYDQMSRRSRHY